MDQSRATLGLDPLIAYLKNFWIILEEFLLLRRIKNGPMTSEVAVGSEEGNAWIGSDPLIAILEDSWIILENRLLF